MYKHAMTALATAATSVLLVAAPATAEDARRCAPVTGTVPLSGSAGAVTAPAYGMEIQRFVEQLVQVLKADPAASANQPATPMLDEAGAKALLGQIACRSGDDDRYEHESRDWEPGGEDRGGFHDREDRDWEPGGEDVERLQERDWEPGGEDVERLHGRDWEPGGEDIERLHGRDWEPGGEDREYIHRSGQTVGLSGGVATAEEDENCVTYKVGPGWSPNWPVLDALGVRDLIEQSSGTASVCVGDPSLLPGGAPSTTAVEPLSEPRSQELAAPLTQTAPRTQAQPRVYPYSRVQLQSTGQPLLESLGITTLLRSLIGR